MQQEDFADEAILSSGLHLHCFSCYSSVLCTRDGDWCDFVRCPNSCGAVYHACKEPEHLELCSTAVVPCLNSAFGCPASMARKDLGRHLCKCAASVVACMAEWNRWPVYCRERQSHFPFRQKNPCAKTGQLDYELAMRDQRMMSGLEKISRKTRVALRNNLTKRYPALPLPHSVDSRPWDENDKGYQRDVLEVEPGDMVPRAVPYRTSSAGLSRQMKEWQDDLEERLKGKERPPHYWEHPELEKGGIHEHCAYCFKIDCKREFGLEERDRSCRVSDCRHGCGQYLHNCKMLEHQMVCPEYEEPDEYAWMYRGVESYTRAATKAQRRLKKNNPNLKEVESLLVGPGFPAASMKAKQTLVKGSLVPAPPPIPESVLRVCRLNLNLDTVTRLQTKPTAAYTFVCAQEFRRDEFAWHSKNVHNDIHGGLNNWMEHRCPLAAYGCQFSSRRLYPHDANHTVTYSSAIESFGVTKEVASPCNRHKDGQAKSLFDLPNELLIGILLRLDSFSLCNLAVTSVFLRELCCSLLDRKGCVTLQWERNRKNNRYHWQIAYKRWFFSPSMEPVERWKFTETESVAQHLEQCPFNIREPMKKVTKNEQWDKVLKALEPRFRTKRIADFKRGSGYQ